MLKLLHKIYFRKMINSDPTQCKGKRRRKDISGLKKSLFLPNIATLGPIFEFQISGTKSFAIFQ